MYANSYHNSHWTFSPSFIPSDHFHPLWPPGCLHYQLMIRAHTGDSQASILYIYIKTHHFQIALLMGNSSVFHFAPLSNIKSSMHLDISLQKSHSNDADDSNNNRKNREKKRHLLWDKSNKAQHLAELGFFLGGGGRMIRAHFRVHF